MQGRLRAVGYPEETVSTASSEWLLIPLDCVSPLVRPLPLAPSLLG